MLVSDFVFTPKRKTVAHNMGVGSHCKNDCIIQALTNTLERPYQEMRALALDWRWKAGKGISVQNTFQLLTRHGFSCERYGKSITTLALSGLCQSDNWHAISPTLGTWLKTDAAQEGRYIVNVRGHVFSVINGTVYDSFASSIHKRICAVYKLNQG